MVNHFNSSHLAALIRLVDGSTSVAKLSGFYTNSVVIGRPGVEGAILLCQSQEEDQDGKCPFLVNFFPHSNPKSVADGKVAMTESLTDRFYNWSDLEKFITTIVGGNYSESTFYSL